MDRPQLQVRSPAATKLPPLRVSHQMALLETAESFTTKQALCTGFQTMMKRWIDLLA